MTNRLLKAEMALHGDSLKVLSEHLGITHQTLSRKISGIVDFTQTEMSTIKKRYELSDEKFAQIFTKEKTDESHRRSTKIK